MCWLGSPRLRVGLLSAVMRAEAEVLVEPHGWRIAAVDAQGDPGSGSCAGLGQAPGEQRPGESLPALSRPGEQVGDERAVGRVVPWGAVHGEESGDQLAAAADYAAGVGPELAEGAAEERAGLRCGLGAAGQVCAGNPAVEVQLAEPARLGRARSTDGKTVGQGSHGMGDGVGDECQLGDGNCPSR